MPILEADGVMQTMPSAFSLHGVVAEPEPVPTPQGPRWRRWLRGAVGFCGAGFQTFWLVTVLALMTAVPLVQLIAFGYLLDIAGRLTNGRGIRDSLDWLRPAGQLGKAIMATLLVALPISLLGHWASVADIVSPGSEQATILRRLASGLVVVGTLHLGWAWARGGRVWHYFWPQPLLFLKRAWRPSTWAAAADRLGIWLASWHFGRRFWLGVRGAAATLIWLLPATVIIAANRHGQTGLAGLVGALALLALGVALTYLPMLQANFAAEDRFGAMFEVRRIRQDFRHAPWAWVGAMMLALVLLPIPLYLLKIEPPPRELVWLPTWLFIAFMMPARIACGLALRRARNRPARVGWVAGFWRWSARAAIVPIVAVYLLFVYLSQYTSWDGLQTWVQQHAVLVPVPFVAK